jgi:hypothetical protein
MPPWIPAGFEEANLISWEMDDEISRAVIRLWCETLEDANPVYYDDALALAYGYPGIICPPTMLMLWCTRAEWTPQGPVPTLAEMFRDNVPEFPHAVGLRSSHVHSRPLQLGERLTVHQFVNPPSPERLTERGPGRSVVRFHSLRDEDGQEIASLEIESVRMRLPAAPSDQDIELPAMPQWSNQPATAQTSPEPLQSGARPEVGDLLPALSTVVTYKRFIKWVAATRDFFEAHHDRDYARSRGAPDMYIGVHFFHGLVGRFMTDWTGPDGFLRRMDFRSWGRCFPGETVTVVGRVTGVRNEVDGTYVDLEIACGCARGKLYDAVASVQLNAPDTP